VGASSGKGEKGGTCEEKGKKKQSQKSEEGVFSKLKKGK
jgi:hypothetical protein